MTPNDADKLTNELNLGNPMPIVGYGSQVSAYRGQSITFFISVDPAGPYRAEVVRLWHGDTNPDGPGFRVAHVRSRIEGEYEGITQATWPGSYAVVDDDASLRIKGSLTLQVLICPTSLGLRHDQVIMAKRHQDMEWGFSLRLDTRDRVEFRLEDAGGVNASVTSPVLVREGNWYFVGASYDADAGVVSLDVEASLSRYANRLGRLGCDRLDAIRTSGPAAQGGTFRGVQPLTFGCGLDRNELTPSSAISRDHFNGKIGCPRLLARVASRDEMERLISDPRDEALLGAWNFAPNWSQEHGVRDVDTVYDVSKNALHGRLVNSPMRGVTGHNWSGRHFDFRYVLSEYDAIWFHEDDLSDARWAPSLEVAVGSNWSSGVYALHVTTPDGHEDFVPFVVRPEPAHPTADVAVLLPTATYLAYGNQRTVADRGEQASEGGVVRVMGKEDIARTLHREWGASTYDTHRDGCGICHGSWLRPVLNVRPKYRHSTSRVWLLNADLHLIDWLDHMETNVDIITDVDLHREGLPVIQPYKVVMTGTHPEYCSVRMLDALEDYLGTGGRVMYLGGNGFYWAIAFHPDNDNIIEVRRWGGSEPWTNSRGEGVLSLSGEMGGTWRARGRDPEKLVGVGNVAQGLEQAGFYVRRPESYEGAGAWIFEGLDSASTFGAFGLEGGGAAGMEVDSFDPRRGSAEEVQILATSRGHGSRMLEVRENFGFSRPFIGAAYNPRVHADLVYWPLDSGGAVFGVGSISWCGSLSHNNYDNPIATITANVLRAFRRNGACAWLTD